MMGLVNGDTKWALNKMELRKTKDGAFITLEVK
jgi:hypothetical protein